MKLRRSDTDDRERMLVHLNGSSDNAGITLKTAVPIGVAEHDIRSAVRTVFIGTVEETTDVRLNAQDIEIITAYFIDPEAGWVFAGIQPGLRNVIGCKTIKAAIAIAQIEIVGVRLDS